MKKSFAWVAAMCWLIGASAQDVQLRRVDPPFWWSGMQDPALQLTVYGPGIGDAKATVSYPGITLDASSRVPNPNYLFLDLRLAPDVKPGLVPIVFEHNGRKIEIRYEIKSSPKTPETRGLDGSDLVYLIMPDRFANGDPTNDELKGSRDTITTRKSPYLRHGGDFKGITDHLSYLEELGVSAIWLTPVIINDGAPVKEGHGNMQSAYHGYHFTDHYRVDPRLGGNEGYLRLIDTLHDRGIKVVQDAVYNHVGKFHWLYLDPPADDWFVRWPAYTEASHREGTLSDPHGAEADRQVQLGGWFTPFLPDINHHNPFFAKYLIQNAIWHTAYFGLDAWRIDTYKYNDLAFMNACNAALVREFPGITLFGESWVNHPAGLAYFVENNLKTDFACNLESTVDFPTQHVLARALTEKPGWDEGLMRLYQVLAQDFLYAHPEKLVTFLDNHDTDRFYSTIGESLPRFKMAMGWLLTTRGIPQLYYGTEILMKNFKNPTDAEVRQDFPGGFAGDKVNKFTAAGRTPQEQEAFAFTQALIKYRRQSSALSSGALTQFVPKNGVYVFFRHDDSQTVMVIMNQLETSQTLSTERFQERMKGFTQARNVLTGATVSSLGSLSLPAQSITILELNP
ncbi:MAG: glycoside hydrolase family 13 protein [Bacteroidia bacterium]|nr:glycoside hydrolase family 13 protein [Bacteroidia bacterium]